MTEKIAMVVIVGVIGLLSWCIYLGNNSNIDQIRKEILTGQVLCKPVGLDDAGELVFKCKTKQEIEEVINFLGGNNERGQR